MTFLSPLSLCFCIQPKIVEALLGYELVQMACGASHVLAVTNEREVFAWGRGHNGRVNESVVLRPHLIYLSLQLLVFVCDLFITTVSHTHILIVGSLFLKAASD